MGKTGVVDNRRRTRHAGALSKRGLGLPTSDGALEIRRQLARELHDRVAQTLSTMLIDIERFKSEQAGRASVLRQLDLVQGWTRDALANVRDIVYDLRGDAVEGDDFPALLRTGLLDPFADRTGIEVRMVVAGSWPAELPPGIALDLYRIVQEALQNAHRHGRARRVEVALGLAVAGGVISITVSDDGRGLPAIEELRPGHGIIGMRERAMLLGGALETERLPAGGTSIRVSVPLADATSRQSANHSQTA